MKKILVWNENISKKVFIFFYMYFNFISNQTLHLKSKSQSIFWHAWNETKHSSIWNQFTGSFLITWQFGSHSCATMALSSTAEYNTIAVAPSAPTFFHQRFDSRFAVAPTRRAEGGSRLQYRQKHYSAHPLGRFNFHFYLKHPLCSGSLCIQLGSFEHFSGPTQTAVELWNF